MAKIIAFFKSLFAKKAPVKVVQPKPVEAQPQKPQKPVEDQKPVEQPKHDESVVIDPTPWFTIAKKELGVKETRGGETKRILEYHAATTLKATEDEVPWCSAFVTWCLKQTGYKSTESAWARSYIGYGKKLDKPKPGCIVVFSRGPSSGHVAFFVKENLTTITCLGGNQSDSVCYSEYAKYKVLAYVWPVK